jgi:outer membrane protein assembly factor BamB
LSDLSGEPPALLWEVRLGEGHAGAAISGGRAYLLDYLEDAKRDALRCFELSSGAELWRLSWSNPMKRNHGFSRTVPAIEGGRALCLGPTCLVVCADAATGEPLWSLDMAERWGAKVPLWYSGQCPLVIDGRAYLAPAGSALIACLDMATGEVIWEASNPEGIAMSHSSLMPFEALTGPALAYAGLGGIAAVSMAEGSEGEILWSYAGWAPQVVSPSPLIAGSRLFQTAGYGAGSLLLDIGGPAPKALAAWPVGAAPSSEQHTPVARDGVLYCVMPKDAGEWRERLVCASLEGTVLWAGGRGERLGLGPYLMADGKIYALSDTGTLYAYAARRDACELLGSAKLFDALEAWAPMAVSGTRLVLRDATRLMCYDIGAKEGVE